MQRYNPFADSSLTNDPFTYNRSSSINTSGVGTTEERAASGEVAPAPVPVQPAETTGSTRYTSLSASSSTPPAPPPPPPPPSQPSSSSNRSTIRTSSLAKYTTSFPDPFGDQDEIVQNANETANQSSSQQETVSRYSSSAPNQVPQARSNSVTFSPTISSSFATNQPSTSNSPIRSTGRRQQTPGGSGFSSFLSRATSVTSSTVTDRVSEAVGSVRSAVDSISSQIQAVPSNINERLTSSNVEVDQQAASTPQLSAAANYLSSKISSATGGGNSSQSLAVISRQRVILILEDLSTGTDWLQQFNNYYRLTSASSKGLQSAFSSFISSAAAQLTSSSTSNNTAGDDLIEQADFRDISILANQGTSTATIFVQQPNYNFPSQQTSSGSVSPSFSAKRSKRIVRPEYVVVRQRTKERLDYLKSIVNGLDYCLIPMFEPVDIWNTFQDRQLIFSRLLRVQKALGKENFPLIPQIFCQTHNDLLNYINSSSIGLPCLARVGPMGKGKIKIDNLQMLRDFASIMETSGLSCTLEQFLNVNYDIIVQKLGTSLKSFKRNPQSAELNAGSNDANTTTTFDENRQDQDFLRQTLSKPGAIGSSVLSSLMVTSAQQQQQQQQLSRQSSNSLLSKQFEKLSNVSIRQKQWVEAISKEFDNKLDVFCIKVIATQDDREYIVGLGDCSMEFMGSFDNQEEDRRSFVELVISKMNTILPKGQLSRESSIRKTSNPQASPLPISASSLQYDSEGKNAFEQQTSPLDTSPLKDKKRFTSQLNINGTQSNKIASSSSRGGAQLGNRSQSVSANQSDYSPEPPVSNLMSFFSRRESDRSGSLVTNAQEANIQDGQSVAGTVGGSTENQQQSPSSFGQTLFNQTSSAINNIQRQSLSLFKRLDSRSELTSTPPLSAKSDKAFDRSFVTDSESSQTVLATTATGRDGFKSQSIDSSSLDGSKLSRAAPAKPPPPQSFSYRQSSLASSPMHRPNSSSNQTAFTPNTTPIKRASECSRQSTGNQESSERTKVVRQNSALSAFAPFDDDLIEPQPANISATQQATETTALTESGTKKRLNSDSISITSGESSGTKEGSGEDTMNILNKTFASILGNKVQQ